MQYNKKEHLKLLRARPKSKRIETSLSDEEFVKSLGSQPILDEKFFKLREYSVMLICHLHWENREQYFELIEKLLTGPLHFLELRQKHQTINDAGESLEADLILLEPNERSVGFDDLVDELVTMFDLYCPDPSIRESHELSEEKIRDLVQKIYIEMKKQYPLDSNKNV